MDIQELNKYIIFSWRNELKHEKPNNQSGTKRDGVAIAIKKSLLPFVKGIYRTNEGIMEIRHKTGKSIKRISILNSYAPHIGYPTETLENTGDMESYR